jgi:hypothetical protein
VSEAVVILLSLGQQVMQQQQGGAEQPTVCFAAVPLMLPAAVIMLRALRRQIRKTATQLT